MKTYSLSLLFASLALATVASAQSAIVHSAFDTPVFENGRSMGGPNLLLAIKTQAPTTIVVTRIEVFTGERTGLNTLGIWRHDPVTNAPAGSLGGGSWQMCRRNDWQGCLMPTPIVLTTGQDFWIVWGPQNGAQASSEGTGAGAQPYRGSFNGGASWNGPFQSVQWKFRLWTGTAGHYEIYGAGCAGSNGTPQLCWTGWPMAGGSFDVHLDNAPASSGALLSFGFSDSFYGGNALPYSLGGVGAPGCNVLAAPQVTAFVITDAAGHFTFPVALPANPAFVGIAFFDQWFCLDSAANSLGLTVSNGGSAIVGM